MIYDDAVYGEIEISEPILLELVNCEEVQRLKGISQSGCNADRYFVTGEENNLTRFNHSIGVLCFLSINKRPVIEQIAGLLHDMAHTVFSHCVDYIFSNAQNHIEQNYHDKVFQKYLKGSKNVINVLNEYGISAELVMKEIKNPLLKNEQPKLCADRIDYGLRDGLMCKMAIKKETSYIFQNLFVGENEWVFKNYASARMFAELFLSLNKDRYASLSAAAMFKTTGDLLKYALEKKYISRNDLFATDKEIIIKIKQFLADDEKLRRLFNRIDRPFFFKGSFENHDARVFLKSRVVDPLYLAGGAPMFLSETDQRWKETVAQELKPKEFFLRFWNE